MEPDIETFIRSNVPTLWALEVLLALRDKAPAAVAPETLVQQKNLKPPG